MVSITALFITGIIIEAYLDLSLMVLLFMAIPVIVLKFIRKSLHQRVLVISFIVLSGAIRVAVYNNTSPSSLSNYAAKRDSVYQVTAIIQTIGETRKGTPKYIISPILIDSDSIVSGKMILYAKDLAQIPAIGDTIIAGLLLNDPRSRRNPHDFDYRKYLFAQGIYFECFIDISSDPIIIESKTYNFSKSILALRISIKAHFSQNLSKRSAGIMSALILGERSDVDEVTKRDFANTGVIHVLAVSGLHVGYVSLILITLIGIMRVPYKIQNIMVIIGLIAYVVLTGGAPSVMRASIMASLIFIGTSIERKADVFNILAAAAFIILMINPSQLSNIGFQLSFSAVFSIVLLFPVFQSWVPKLSIKPTWLSVLIQSTIDLFLVSLSAQLGTLAITIYYFNKVPIISLLANLIVVPLIGLIVATGMTSLIIGSIIPILSELWGALLEGVIDFLLWFVAKCSQFDWSYITIRQINVLELVLILFAVGAIAFLSRWRLLATWIVLMLIWGNALMWSGVFIPSELEFITLDVGQGDALILHSPNHKTLVVDAGLKFGGRDMGRDIVSPYLIQRNWNTIDLLIITHPHNDHIGGALYLIEHHDVKRVLIQDVHYDSYGYHNLIRAIDSLNIPTASAFAGMIDSSLAPIYMRVTGPKVFDKASEPKNVNNISIVMQVFYGNTDVLLTGDAEKEMERHQLMYGELLRSDMIKAPHHGSKTSSSAAYLTLIQPDVCIISLGPKNKYKHPSPETLSRYSALGSMIHRTDIEGAIIYKSDGKCWSHQQWRSPD